MCTAEVWHRSLPYAELYCYDKLSNPPDRNMLDIARSSRPNVILFCGVADWSRMPSPSTLRQLREQAPVVLLSGDLSDPPWWPYLQTFRDAESFDLMVNFDGNDLWPHKSPDFTALTPMSPTFYRRSDKLLKDRLIPFGFCGGCSSPSRYEIINHLVDHAGLQIKPREEIYGTYQRFANFMMECAIVPNVPFSGSDNARQVKGRVIESGLARCCLLDHVSSASKNWFTPGEDYIEYENREHAVALAKELSGDWGRAQRIADNLHRRVTEEYSAEKFWAKVFEAAGVA